MNASGSRDINSFLPSSFGLAVAKALDVPRVHWRDDGQLVCVCAAAAGRNPCASRNCMSSVAARWCPAGFKWIVAIDPRTGVVRLLEPLVGVEARHRVPLAQRRELCLRFQDVVPRL